MCIVQDDPKDQQAQIRNMHGIHKTAFVTIVAASGEHSDSGLPGLRPNTREHEQREVAVVDTTDGDAGLSFVTAVKSNPQHWDTSFQSGKEILD